MTVTVEPIQPVQGPARIGQATAVEQSRAVAEVAAAVQVAQACPRDLGYAVDEMRRSCQQQRLAERAFFRYSRGDGPVTGPSIHLARELARCWGNVQYGVHELRRDDEHGQSEMQAWAWDVQTNSRASTTFIVPHARDTKRGRRDLTDLRDIYENNANNAARRLREMILGLLPQWYVEEAKDLCTRTIEQGGGKPLAQRVAESLKAFAALGVTQDRIERRIGHPASAWTPQDMATLSVVYTSITRGEIRVEDEFDVSAVSVADVAPTQDRPINVRDDAKPAPAEKPAPAAERTGPLTSKQWRAINARFNELGVVGQGQAGRRRDAMVHILKREIASPDDMTEQDGVDILANLDGESGVALVADVLGIRPAEEVAPDAADDELAAARLANAEGANEQDPGAVEDAFPAAPAVEEPPAEPEGWDR